MTREIVKRERKVTVGFIVVVLSLIALGGLALFLYDQNQMQDRAIHSLQTESVKKGDAIDALSNDSKKLRDKLAKEGVNPNTIAPPPEKRTNEVPEPTVVNNTIIQRPTYAQVQSAVESVMKSNPDLTQSQIVSAVGAYLKANPPPAGPAGKNGANGKDGTNGVDGASGPPGPSPTQEQVDAAVVAYCDSHDGCAGPPGPTGQPGADGTDAVPFSFIFTIPEDPPLKPARTYKCTISAPDTNAECVLQNQ